MNQIEAACKLVLDPAMMAVAHDGACIVSHRMWTGSYVPLPGATLRADRLRAERRCKRCRRASALKKKLRFSGDYP